MEREKEKGVYYMSAYSKIFFRPGRGEQISTTVTLEQESESAICGRVRDKSGRAVENAMVLLFKSDMKDKVPQCRFFTDEDGQFFFGPLESEALYIIKILKNDTKLRELEIVTE
jgi:hypothetical protein